MSANSTKWEKLKARLLRISDKTIEKVVPKATDFPINNDIPSRIETAIAILESERYVVLVRNKNKDGLELSTFSNSHTNYKEIISDVRWFADLLQQRQDAIDKIDELLKDNNIDPIK